MAEYTEKIQQKFGNIADRLDQIAEQKSNQRADKLRSEINAELNDGRKTRKEVNQNHRSVVSENKKLPLQVEEPPETQKFNQLMKSFQDNYQFVLDLEESVDSEKHKSTVDEQLKNLEQRIKHTEQQRHKLEMERKEKEAFLKNLDLGIQEEQELQEKLDKANNGELEFWPRKDGSSGLSQEIDSSQNYDILSEKESFQNISWVDNIEVSLGY